MFCHQLTQLRLKIGLPWGILTELHGWYTHQAFPSPLQVLTHDINRWHILSALGVYHFIAFVETVRMVTVKDGKKNTVPVSK